MDELDRLKAALQAGPVPDDQARARALAQATDNFDKIHTAGTQGLADGLRSMSDRSSRAGFMARSLTMLKSVTTRSWLAATTSVAALALGMVIVLPLADLGRLGDLTTEPQVADDVALKADAPKEEAPALVEREAVEVPAPLGRAVTATEADDGMADAATAPAEPAPGGAEMATGVVGLAAPAPLVADSKALPPPEPNTEAFANASANPVHVTVEEPVSTFSIDVDTASYGVVRSSLNAGQLPAPEAVRVEEMVNYFPYAYPAPEAGQAFRPSVTVMPSPWNEGTRLVHIAIQGALPEVAARPALNLVFLIDTSGSMDEPNKLPLLKRSLALMLDSLQPRDQVAIVTYAGSAGEVLAPTAAGERAVILQALDRLAAGGGTAGAEGIALAYQVAEGMAEDGEVSRVLLATDGDFNLGIADPEALKTFIEGKRDSGVYLSVLGFGRGNLDDATMQALAQNGNGTASYIDTLSEARKVLVDQLTGALYPIADNVKIQVEWNPAQVAEYRLIGYETRALAREDFNNDKVDAGDIGAGAQVTAIYEITAPGSSALLNDPLRYGTVEAGGAGELGFLRLRSVAPGGTSSTLQEVAILPQMASPTDDARFAVAIAGMGQMLSGAKYLGQWGWDEAIDLAVSARGADEFGYRAEAVTLMRLAQSLSR